MMVHMTSPAHNHFSLRADAISSLIDGSADAADVVARAWPAVELLGLLVPVDGLTENYLRGRAHAGLQVTRADFEPWRRQLLAVVAALLDRWIGRDQAAWLELVRRAGPSASFVDTLVSVADGEGAPDLAGSGGSDRPDGPDRSGRSAREGRAPRWPRGVDASAVLLAMAPPGVVEAFLEDCVKSPASRGILTRMLDRGPLHPLFVDYVLGALGTQAMRDALTRNPALVAASLRARVLRLPESLDVLEHAYLAPEADRALRIGCVRRAEAVGGFRPRFAARLVSNDSDVAVLEPLLVSGDPQLVHWVLKRINNLLATPSLRWAGYATLARTAGPEPVWALEQERVGTLVRMAEPVRRSLATGDVAPILAAAEALPPTVGPEGSELELGGPLIEPWPYTRLIRDHVEGDAHRMRLVADPRESGRMVEQGA
jgi:hypothetical protein